MEAPAIAALSGLLLAACGVIWALWERGGRVSAEKDRDAEMVAHKQTRKDGAATVALLETQIRKMETEIQRLEAVADSKQTKIEALIAEAVKRAKPGDGRDALNEIFGGGKS